MSSTYPNISSYSSLRYAGRNISVSFILVLLIWFNITHAQLPSWNLDLVSESRISGYYKDIVIVDTLAYFSTSYGLEIYDLSNINDIEFVRRIPTPGYTNKIVTRDSLMIVSNHYEGIRIYNTVNQPDLTEICYYPEVIGGDEMKIDGQYMYVLNNNKISIIDIEDPTQPEFVSEYNNRAGMLEHFDFINDYVYYTMDHLRFLGIINIEDKANPMLVDVIPFLPEGDQFYNISSYQDFLLLISMDMFRVLSVDDPESPEQIGGLDGAFGSKKILSRNDLVYTSSYWLSCIDMNDPEDPILLARLNRGTNLDLSPKGEGLAIVDNNLFVADGRGQARAYDVSNPERFELIWEHFNPIRTENVAVNSEFAYVDNVQTYMESYVETMNIEDPENPVQVNSNHEVDDYGEGFFNFEIIENRLYISSDRTCGLRTLSLDNPAQPILVNTLNVRGYLMFYDFIHFDNYLYGGAYDHGVVIFSIEDPDAPRFIREAEYYPDGFMRGCGYDIAIAENRLFNSSRMFGLVIYDLENPDNPEFISATDFDTEIRHIAAIDNYVYGSCNEGLLIFDAENPERPELVNLIEGLSNYYTNIEIRNEKMFFYNQGVGGVKVLSLENREEPELIAFYDTPGYPYRIDIKENYIFVADSYDLSILDASHAFNAWYIETSNDVHDFGEVPLDSSESWDITLTNRSQDERVIADMTLDNNVFELAFEDEFTLQSAEDTTFTITFSPAHQEDYSANLVIHSQDHELPILLLGRGVVLDAKQPEPTPVPLEFAIRSIHPNPFNSTTTIAYTLPCPEHVTLTVFDQLGRRVDRLLDVSKPAGLHTAHWNAGGNPSGVYFLTLQAGGEKRQMEVVLVR